MNYLVSYSVSENDKTIITHSFITLNESNNLFQQVKDILKEKETLMIEAYASENFTEVISLNTDNFELYELKKIIKGDQDETNSN
jgi:hypothetical protein